MLRHFLVVLLLVGFPVWDRFETRRLKTSTDPRVKIQSYQITIVLLWTTAASILTSILGRTLVETARPSDSRRADVRDREIRQLGEYASRWFVVAGAGAALIMAMARWDYFWIANVLYLGFVLWAVSGSVLRLVAYRRGG